MRIFWLGMVATLMLLPFLVKAEGNECVVIFPDLYYRQSAPTLLADYLQNLGYRVVVVNYPSTDYSVPSLSSKVVAEQVQQGCPGLMTRLHFIGYLLGNVVLRQYLFDHAGMQLGRVVLIEPPNKDTVKEDHRIAGHPVYKAYFTDEKKVYKADTRPEMENRVDFEPGVILANARFTDKKKLFKTMQKMKKAASTGRTRKVKIPGLGDMVYVHALPQFAISRKEVIFQTAYYVQNGDFYSSFSQAAAPQAPRPMPTKTMMPE